MSLILTIGLFTHYPCVVHGSSMEPVLHKGDRVTVNRINKIPKIGDVIVFDAGHDYGLVIHRVVAYKPKTGEYITKGDNNEGIDKIYPTKDVIIGVVNGYKS